MRCVIEIDLRPEEFPFLLVAPQPRLSLPRVCSCSVVCLYMIVVIMLFVPHLILWFVDLTIPNRTRLTQEEKNSLHVFRIPFYHCLTRFLRPAESVARCVAILRVFHCRKKCSAKCFKPMKMCSPCYRTMNRGRDEPCRMLVSHEVQASIGTMIVS